MIHILTVHWKDPMWIDIQLDYLNKYLTSEYKVYAFLNDIPQSYESKFYYTSTEDITSHSIKLNILADLAIFNSKDDNDILLFIDGDAFPIAPIETYIKENITKHKLVAIQRKENNGDIQPHPCFCATTIGLWKEIKGDWNQGYLWTDKNNNQVTDVGGNLLELLEHKKINWKKMLRSNKSNTHHPLWFGIYEDLIYHHGAGFREPVSREDKKMLRSAFKTIIPKNIQNTIKHTSLFKKLYSFIGSSKEMKSMSNEIFLNIKSDYSFYKKL